MIGLRDNLREEVAVDTGGDGGGGGDAGGSATLFSGEAGTATESEGGGSATTTESTGGQGTESWISADGALTDGWQKALLGEEFHDNATLGTFKDLNTMAKSLVDTKAMVGKKLEAPGEDASPEQLTAWRKTVGAPETADDYGSLRPESVPADLWDDGGEAAVREIAHKHSIPPAALKDLMEVYGSELAGGLESSEADQAATLQGEGAKLREAWGGEYDTNLATASRVAQTVGLSTSHPSFGDAEIVKAFAKFGSLISESKLVAGENVGLDGSNRARIASFADSKSTDPVVRDYHGANGAERQLAAQNILHNLKSASQG